MRLNCSYCGKLVSIMRLNFQGKSSPPSRGKLVRTLGTGFNVASITSNRRRLSMYGLQTRVTCITCKSKVKTQKPLDYLTKALASTLSATDEMDVDDISPNNDVNSEDNLFGTDMDENLRRDESIDTNPWKAKRDYIPEPITWDSLGTANMIEVISERQGALREIVDFAPFLPNERYMRHFVYNMHEQMQQRNNLIRQVNVPNPPVVNNIPVPIAEQQALVGLEVENIPNIPDRNHENHENIYEILSARIAFLDRKLKSIEEEYSRLCKRINDSLMTTKKVDETVAAAMKFLGRDFPGET